MLAALAVAPQASGNVGELSVCFVGGSLFHTCMTAARQKAFVMGQHYLVCLCPPLSNNPPFASQMVHNLRGTFLAHKLLPQPPDFGLAFGKLAH
jgi:hypothetical protein